MPDQVIPCSLKVAVGVGNFGSRQVWAYLKLMLHLHATLSPSSAAILACAGLSQLLSRPLVPSLPLCGAPSFDELNIAAT